MSAPAAPDEPRLWQLVRERAEATPDAVLAVDEHDRTITFGALHERALAVAAGLHALGIGPGSTVAWQLPTRLESIVLVAALARLDATQVPMLPIYREREVRFILAQTRPALFVVPTAWRGFAYGDLATRVVTELGLDCRIVRADPDLPSGTPGALAAVPQPDAGSDPLRWVFFTSGTTAAPKGALHTDGSIVAGAAAVARAYAMQLDDRYPIVFPFTHIGGIGMLVIQLLSGCSAVAVEQFDPEASIALLARHGITIAAGGTPLALVYLEHQRRHPDVPLFPRLRGVMTGAAPTPTRLHADLRDEMGGRGALSCYGLTEAPFLTVNDVRDTDRQRSETEGRAVGGAELRIVARDADGTEHVCPPGVAGEIRARGPQICRGYLDPSRNAEAFDSDGWFCTGDLGVLDPDGYLSITGRLKDIIVRKGENISAKEVEDVLFEHAAIADVAVIGLDDPVRGERCCAVVVLREDASPCTLPDLVTFCVEHGLAMQKVPEQFEVVAALPRNASGKILKYELRQRFGAVVPAS